MDITLMINYFNHSNSKRNDEFLFCLNKNINNQYITSIVIFIDNIKEFLYLEKLNKKCKLIESKDRINYSDFFKYANDHITGISIISNLDIYFDESLFKCRFIDFSNTVLSLSRTDLISTCSQDSWIFKTPIITKNFDCDFSLGNPGCDNRIAYEIH